MVRLLCTAFFNVAEFGWSEVYPITAADYAAGDTLFQQVLDARLGTLHSDVSLVGLRISDTDIKGDSYASTHASVAPGTFSGDASTGSYNEELALRLKMYGGPTKRSTRFLRALPEVEVDAFGKYVPSVSFTTAFNAWVGKLVANVSIATKIKGASAPPFYSFQPITTVTVFDMEGRKIGRPFGLPHGRRLIA